MKNKWPQPWQGTRWVFGNSCILGSPLCLEPDNDQLVTSNLPARWPFLTGIPHINCCVCQPIGCKENWVCVQLEVSVGSYSCSLPLVWDVELKVSSVSWRRSVLETGWLWILCNYKQYILCRIGCARRITAQKMSFSSDQDKSKQKCVIAVGYGMQKISLALRVLCWRWLSCGGTAIFEHPVYQVFQSEYDPRSAATAVSLQGAWCPRGMIFIYTARWFRQGFLFVRSACCSFKVASSFSHESFFLSSRCFFFFQTRRAAWQFQMLVWLGIFRLFGLTNTWEKYAGYSGLCAGCAHKASTLLVWLLVLSVTVSG